MKISIRNQPAIDIGGVRRQFFAIVLEHLAHNERYGLFEGLPCSLRPCYRATSLSSGLLTLVGTMVGHNILLDGQGFPYLSECCYYYIAGQIEKAVTCVTTNDVSEEVKFIVSKVRWYVLITVINLIKV